MPHFNRKILAVIGAGPKGIAVAIKAKVLEEFGLPVDKVVIIEKNGVAANWSGDYGYTNGEMKLGTSPEKDVVFPLETDTGDPRLNDRVRRRLLHFTWTSFLIQTGRFSDWIDRGRPAPCHQLWASYLRWVSEQLGPQVTMVKGEVVGIDLSPDGHQWHLIVAGFGPVPADRLMLTGPGQTRVDFLNGELPKETYDLQSFWSALKSKTFRGTGKVAIVGAGENAASVLLALGQYAPELRVDVITPKGFISTRAENFYENQVYSQPDRVRWTEMEFSDRVDFIERTDIGVFSAHAMGILNDQIRHDLIAGRMVGLRKDGLMLRLELEYAGRRSERTYDRVILATGFDQLAFLGRVLSARAWAVLQSAVGFPVTQGDLAPLIQNDLSVAGMSPKLHLPMLAGLVQGPGFANLSCLGRLSDRVMVTQDLAVRQVPLQEVAL